MMKLKPERIGMISIVSPVPGILAASFFGVLWIFYIVFGVLGYEQAPLWAASVGCLPAFISPAIGVFGVIYGLIHHKEQRTVKGILLSLLGILENIVLWQLMLHLSQY